MVIYQKLTGKVKLTHKLNLKHLPSRPITEHSIFKFERESFKLVALRRNDRKLCRTFFALCKLAVVLSWLIDILSSTTGREKSSPISKPFEGKGKLEVLFTTSVYRVVTGSSEHSRVVWLRGCQISSEQSRHSGEWLFFIVTERTLKARQSTARRTQINYLQVGERFKTYYIWKY